MRLCAPAVRKSRVTGGRAGFASLFLLLGSLTGIGAGAPSASALSANTAPGSAPGAADTVDPTTTNPLSLLQTVNLNGGYVAAGVAMRNLGQGTVDLTGIPFGSTVQEAYLLWDVLNTTFGSSLAHGTFNGTAITGTLIGSGGSPCWPTGTFDSGYANYSFQADVTTLVSGNGNYAVSGFASGSSAGATPITTVSPFPELEGATLVVVYANASSPATSVQVYGGANETQESNLLTQTITGFTASPSPTAYTTFIVADGQTYVDTGGTFNGKKLVATFRGATHQTSPAPSRYPATSYPSGAGNLWDTSTFNVSSLVHAGDTSATATVEGTTDCLVWVGQVFSTTTGNPSISLAVTPPAQLLPRTSQVTYEAIPSGTLPASVTLVVGLRTSLNPSVLLPLPSGVTRKCPLPACPSPESGMPSGILLTAAATAALGVYALVVELKIGTTVLATQVVQLAVTEIAGITNDVTFTGVTAKNTTLYPGCAGILGTADSACFTIQQNFYVHVPNESPALAATYWVQNVLVMFRKCDMFAGPLCLVSRWVAGHEYEVFTVRPTGEFTAGSIRCPFLGRTLHIAHAGLPCLLSATSNPASLSSLPISLSLTSTVSGGCIHFFASVSSSSQTFCTSGTLENGFIGVGDSSGTKHPPRLAPELALVGAQGDDNVAFTNTSGAVTASTQLSQIDCTPVVNVHPLASGNASTAEQSSGLLWTPQPNQALFSSGSSTSVGIYYEPTC